MESQLLETQLIVYKTELAEVNAKILDLVKTGEEFEVGTSAGLKNRVRQVPYNALVRRQKELLHAINDLEVIFGMADSGRVSYVH